MGYDFSETGERIKFLMDLNNMKQIDICKMTGISKNAISNYINGNRIPDTVSLYKLAEHFNVSMEWLLTGKNLSAGILINKHRINEK